MLIRQAEAIERSWQLSAACQPHRDKKGQKQAWHAAEQIGETGRIRKSPLELVDASTRIEMIGGNLKLYGERWAGRNRSHLDWLASMGITPEQAIARHEAWHDREMADPFWSHNRGERKRGREHD